MERIIQISTTGYVNADKESIIRIFGLDQKGELYEFRGEEWMNLKTHKRINTD